MSYLLWIELGAYAIGTLGAVLLFLEFFQTPPYIVYHEDRDRYRLSVMNDDIDEYTSLGRIGAFLIAAAFALLFVVTMFGG